MCIHLRNYQFNTDLKRSSIDARGFSLVEVLVATALIGIFVLVSMSISEYVSGVMRASRIRNDIAQLTALLSQRLDDKAQCKETISGGGNVVVLHNGGGWLGLGAGGSEITGYVPGIRSGSNMTGNTVAKDTVLPLMGLQIDSFRIQDAVALNTVTDPILGIVYTRYQAKLMMEVSNITNAPGGKLHRPILLGAITFSRKDDGGWVKDCSSGMLTSTADICEAIGCKYDAAKLQPCDCTASVTNRECAVGQYATGITNFGIFRCENLGGACAPGSYLVGVGLGAAYCKPMPVL